MEVNMKILKMIEEGKITALQAAQLIGNLEGNQTYQDSPEAPLSAVKEYDKKMFRIAVNSAQGDKVNIQFPVGAVKKIIQITGKLPIPQEKLQGIDLDQMLKAVLECFSEDVDGDFVNAVDKDGNTLRIYVE